MINLSGIIRFLTETVFVMLLYFLMSIILVPISNVAISGYTSLTQVASGVSITLTCTVSGGNPSPTIKWLYDNVEVDVTIDSTYGSDFINEYTFTTSVHDNGAIYKCVADNGVTIPVNKEVILNVEGKWLSNCN